MYRTLSIDGTFLARSSYEGGGMFKGFIYRLNWLRYRFPSKLVYVCWDSKGGHRREVSDTYKATRIPAPPDFYEELEELKEILPLFGVSQAVATEGGEGDDVLYTISRTMPGPHLLFSCDKDLYQAVSHSTHLYRWLRNEEKSQLVSLSNFWECTGLSCPKAYTDYLCLRGDASDNIAGVPGIGDKRAKGILNHCSHIDVMDMIMKGDYEQPRLVFEHSAYKDYIELIIRSYAELKLAYELVPLVILELTITPSDEDRISANKWLMGNGLASLPKFSHQPEI
jgi:5'-3' exonuclease